MKVTSIQFENYKSFKNQNILRVDNSITTIIGKNESGKSNLIDLFGSLSITQEYNRDFFKKWNRNKQGISYPIVMTLEIDPDEAREFNLNEKTATIIFNEQDNPKISGFLSEYFSKSNFNNLISELKESKELITGMTTAEIKNYQVAIMNIELSSTNICYNFSGNIMKIENSLRKTILNTNQERFESLYTRLDKAKTTFNKLYDRMPIVFQYKENVLREFYTINEKFSKNLSNQPDELKDFLLAAKIDPDDIEVACNTSDRGLKQDLKSNFNELIRKNINIHLMNSTDKKM